MSNGTALAAEERTGVWNFSKFWSASRPAEAAGGKGGMSMTNGHAYMTALNHRFPGSEPEEELFDHVCAVLGELGFTKESCIANIAVCRDELCTPAVGLIRDRLGDPFGMRGLGGLLSAGMTGFGASQAHSPVCAENRRRFVYFHATHIGIGPDGTFGECDRPGTPDLSHACGALMALRGELERSGGKLSGEMDMDDVEMSTLRKLLLPHLDASEEVPDIVDLTKLVSSVVVEEQLKRFVAATVDTAAADYALVAGVQIHAPNGTTFFCPSAENCYAVVSGDRRQISMVRQVNFA